MKASIDAMMLLHGDTSVTLSKHRAKKQKMQRRAAAQCSLGVIIPLLDLTPMNLIWFRSKEEVLLSTT